MTYAELLAAINANEHQQALDGVAQVRFRMLEGQLARAVAARKEAERKLHEYVCTENDEINRLRVQNRRLMGELDLLRKSLSSAVSLSTATVSSSSVLHMPSPEPFNPPRPSLPPRSKRLPIKSSAALRNSELVQRALRGEPFPEPPELGAFDPTITEEDEEAL